MASPFGAGFSPRTAGMIAGLAVVTAAGALLYFHSRRKSGDGGWFQIRALANTSSRPIERPQRRWKVILADNQPGAFVHLKRPGQDPAKKPPPLDAVEYVWVDRKDQLEQLAAELLTVSEFGVDTEQHSQHSFLGYIALLQISTHSRDYVVDTLAVHDHMHLLRAPFSSRHVTKVFHGSDNDILWLQRDFHIYPVNIFDTYRAAIALDKPQKSLAFLLQCYCGVTTDKRFQKSDWRLRPLPEKLLVYARTDAHYLVYIAECMRAALLGGKSREFASFGARESPAETARGSKVEGSALVSDEQEPADIRSARTADDVSRSGADVGKSVADVTRSAADVAKSGADDRRSVADVTKSAADVTKESADVTPFQAISLERLAAVVRRSNELCLQLYDKDASAGGSAPAAALISRHYATPAGAQRARAQSPDEGLRFRELIRALCDWRNKVAREEDESVRAVLSDAGLVALALACPKTPGPLLDIVRECDRRSVNKHPSHPFSEEVVSPSRILQKHASAVCGITARFAASPSHLYKTLEEELSAPETARGNAPGSGPLARNAREPSGWARVDDDSLSKKAHPAKQARDPAAARARFVTKFACKKTVYENCRIYAGDGRLLCYCDRKKLDWYVQKGLAEFSGDDPPSITLRFEPKGRPEDENNEFYISSKSNRCVACGETSHYLRFRLVPSCYRQHFPEHLKSHRSHDIVLLCVDCHEVAHKATERHKKLVARKYGVPLFPAKVQRHGGTAEEAGNGMDGVDPDGLRRAATALIMHGSAMPKERVAELERVVKEYYGKDDLTHRDLMNARMIGMGPKGQRRVYKKKGTRLDEQLFDSIPGDASEGKGGVETTGGYGLGSEEGETSGVENGWRQSGAADASEVAGKLIKEPASGEERKESAVDSTEMRARSADSDASGTESSGSEWTGVDAGSPPDELTRVDGAREGTESGTGGRNETVPVSNPMDRTGSERNGTALHDLEADSDAAEENDLDSGAHSQSGSVSGAESHSRQNGITSRRQRAKLRAQLAGGELELGGERKAVLGHGQHGKRVVEILEEMGGENALRDFAQEWRACFVEALRPTYLPPAWDVKHSGKREFGEFSVYKPKQGENGEELES